MSWLSIISKTGKSAKDILTDHWSKYGRSYYERHDYEEMDSDKANEMFSDMRKRLPRLKGMNLSGCEITRADEFRYVDPVTKDVSEHQGFRFFLADGSRIITRL